MTEPLADSGKAPLLQLQDVSKSFPIGHRMFGVKRQLWAVRPLSLTLGASDILAVVGESGCGKSTLARMMAFVTPPSSGHILMDGVEPGDSGSPADRLVRRQSQLVHQDPYSALNPRKTVRQILTVPIIAHHLGDARQALARAKELLDVVGLTPVDTYLAKFPYELSGGQRQRVVIARALAVNPKVLVADEAVSMIDVSLRQQILATLKTLQQEWGLSVVFISHDMAQAQYFARGHRMMVLYAGHVVEYGPTDAVIAHPRHPYTVVLRGAVLDPDPDKTLTALTDLAEGDFPDLTVSPIGCIFASRCPVAQDICRQVPPPHVQLGDGHEAVCHFAGDPAVEHLGGFGDAAVTAGTPGTPT